MSAHVLPAMSNVLDSKDASFTMPDIGVLARARVFRLTNGLTVVLAPTSPVPLVHIRLFFFSSRRRHTRYIGDWSSDVCYSDLRQNSTGSSSNISPLCSATTKIEMMNARRCILLLAIASSLVLAGCALKNPPFGADIMPESARSQIPGRWAGPHRSGTVVPNWVGTFHDPELSALVADAIERNPDLKAAAARVEASRAAVRVAASSLYPRIAMKGLGERQGQQLSGDLGRNINPPSFGGPGTEEIGRAHVETRLDALSQRWVYGLAAGAAWEADVWGRIRSKKAAARAESYALEADYEFARQSLAAAVARAYFTTIEAAQQEANAQETLDIYQEYSKLTDIQKQQGFASDFDVSQITSRNAAAEDALYAAQAARAQTIRAIEVVTSRYPAGKFDVRRSFPGQPRSVPLGLPAQVLERRPDLIA